MESFAHGVLKSERSAQQKRIFREGDLTAAYFQPQRWVLIISPRPAIDCGHAFLPDVFQRAPDSSKRSSRPGAHGTTSRSGCAGNGCAWTMLMHAIKKMPQQNGHSLRRPSYGLQQWW
jgi:hypothetical protein